MTTRDLTAYRLMIAILAISALIFGVLLNFGARNQGPMKGVFYYEDGTSKWAHE
jgi:hypothetical protein